MMRGDELLNFWSLAIRLKKLRRQGWIDRGVNEPESTADHSWAVALLAWLLVHDRPELDRDRVLLLGLVHDLPEAVAGDATPFDADRDEYGAIPAERFHALPSYSDDARRSKRAAEIRALSDMLHGLPSDLADAVLSAWEEYDAQTTSEAQFVRQVDKLETLIQAEQYQREQPGLVIESFWLGAIRDITDPALALLVANLRSRPDD
jgi:putative hydrolases of HD superfamily